MKASVVDQRLALWLYRGALAVTLVGAGALALLYHYLPLLDFPEHCAQAAIISHLDDPAYRFADYYRSTGWFLPYQLFRWLQIGLGRLLGDELGFRAALLPHLVGMPLAAGWLARGLGRDRWVALSACTILVEGNLLWGFVPYAFGVTLVVAGAALQIDFTTRGGARRLVALALLGVAIFFTHPQATGLHGATATALAIGGLVGRRLDLRRAAQLIAALLPSQALLAYYLLSRGWISGSAPAGELAIGGRAIWYSPWTMTWTLPWSTGLVLDGPGALIAFLAALAGVVAGGLIGWRARRGVGSRETEGLPTPRAAVTWPGAATWLIGAWALLLFALPAKWRGEAISARLASTVALGLLLSLPMNRPRSDAEGRALTLPRGLIALAALAGLGTAHRTFSRHDRSLCGLDSIIATLPFGGRVATLVYEPFPDGGFALPTCLHLGGYLHAARGGAASFSFTRLGTTYRDSVPRERVVLGDPWAPSRRGWVPPDDFAAWYDFIVVRRGPRYPGSPLRPGSRLTAERIVDRDGLELWRITPPTQP